MVKLFCHGAFRNTEICARTWKSQIITSRTWLCTLRMQGHLLFARSVCGRCLGAVTFKYMFSTMFSKDSGISPVKYQNMIGFSSKFCHTSLPLDLLPWKFGNNTLMSFLALLFLREWQLGEELRQSIEAKHQKYRWGYKTCGTTHWFWRNSQARESVAVTNEQKQTRKVGRSGQLFSGIFTSVQHTSNFTSFHPGSFWKLHAKKCKPKFCERVSVTFDGPCTNLVKIKYLDKEILCYMLISTNEERATHGVKTASTRVSSSKHA